MAKTEQSSSRMDTVLKMLLIAFVSLLAFSSGVYFGKQMSDSDHQLKALESDFNTQSTLTAEKGSGAEGEDAAVNDEEVAKLSDKYVNAEKGTRDVASTNEETSGAEKAEAGGEHAAAKTATKAAPKVEEAQEEAPAAATAPAPKAHTASTAATTKPDLSAAHRAAERVANNASPVASETKTPAAATAGKTAETRTPTSLPKTVGASNAVEFTVQVASYPTADAAKSYANDLVKKGFPAFPVEAQINGRTWYRVSVGSFKSMKEATTYRAQLLKSADLQNAIVQKITR